MWLVSPKEFVLADNDPSLPPAPACMHAFRRQYYFHSLAVIIDSIYLPHPTQPPPSHLRANFGTASSAISLLLRITICPRNPTDQPRGRRAFLLKAARGWNGGSGDGRFRLCSSEENPLGRSFNLLSSPPSLGRAGRRARAVERGSLLVSCLLLIYRADIIGKGCVASGHARGTPNFYEF